MNIIGKLTYWLYEWMLSFKYRRYPSWVKSWFEVSSIPEGAKAILFHGLPNLREAVSGKWYQHILLSPWIKGYWVE